MSVAARIKIEGNPGLSKLRKRIVDRTGVLNVAGRSGRNVLVKHLRAYNRTHPNRLGGPRTNFYAKAADAVNFRLLNNDEVAISINAVGISLRYYGTAGLPGGVLRPVRGRYLTIPATPEAHGKRAREFGDLEFGFAYDPQQDRERPALVRNGTQSPTRVARRRVDGRTTTVQLPGGDNAGEPVFWLVKQVRQAGDPTLLPTEAELGDAIVADVEEFLDLLDERSAG